MDIRGILIKIFIKYEFKQQAQNTPLLFTIYSLFIMVSL
ncbi:YoaP domain-containing protein [Clostridium botulinum]